MEKWGLEEGGEGVFPLTLARTLKAPFIHLMPLLLSIFCALFFLLTLCKIRSGDDDGGVGCISSLSAEGRKTCCDGWCIPDAPHPGPCSAGDQQHIIPPLSLHFSTSEIYFVFFSSLWNARPSATLFSRGSLATEEKEIKLPEEGLREGDGKGRRGVSQ